MHDARVMKMFFLAVVWAISLGAVVTLTLRQHEFMALVVLILGALVAGSIDGDRERDDG